MSTPECWVEGTLVWGPGCRNQTSVRFVATDLEAIASGTPLPRAPKKTSEVFEQGRILWGPAQEHGAAVQFMSGEAQQAADGNTSGEPALFRVCHSSPGILRLMVTPVKIKGQPCYRETVDGEEMVIQWDLFKYRDPKTKKVTEEVDRYRIPFKTKEFVTDPKSGVRVEKVVTKRPVVMRDFDEAVRQMRILGRQQAAMHRLMQQDDTNEAKTLYGQFRSAAAKAAKVGYDIGELVSDAVSALQMIARAAHLIIWAKILLGAMEPVEELKKESITLSKLVKLFIDLVNHCGPAHPMLVSAAMKTYKEDADKARKEGRGHGAGSSFKKRRGMATRLAKKFGHRYMHTLRYQEMQDWYNTPSNTAKGSSMRNDLSALRHIFNTARDRYGWLRSGETVADRMTVITGNFLPDPANKLRKIIYTKYQEIEAILSEAWREYREWVVVIVLRAYGGLHLPEIMCLTWRQISLKGVVDVQQNLNGNHCPRGVRLSLPCFAFIYEERVRAEKEGRLDTPVFPGVTTQELLTVREETLRARFDAVFNQICETVGVTRQSNGLRRGFATHIFALTGNLKWTVYLMGSYGIDLFYFYVALNIDRSQAERYFAPPHPEGFVPDIPDYRWIPADKFRSHDEAEIEYGDAVAEERQRKADRAAAQGTKKG